MKTYPFKLNDQVIVIDVNCINARGNSPYTRELGELERLHEQEKITIMKTDMLDTEMLRGEGYPPGLAKASSLIECLGVGVVGFSRVDHCVATTDDADMKLGEILVLLFGPKDRKDYTEQEMGDAMHIHTAGRYRSTKYFVTGDRRLLETANDIRSIVGGLLVCDPKTCLEAVEKAYARWEKLLAGRDKFLKEHGIRSQPSPKQ